jgi:hypothetical protein
MLVPCVQQNECLSHYVLLGMCHRLT